MHTLHSHTHMPGLNLHPVPAGRHLPLQWRLRLRIRRRRWWRRRRRRWWIAPAGFADTPGPRVLSLAPAPKTANLNLRFFSPHLHRRIIITVRKVFTLQMIAATRVFQHSSPSWCTILPVYLYILILSFSLSLSLGRSPKIAYMRRCSV